MLLITLIKALCLNKTEPLLMALVCVFRQHFMEKSCCEIGLFGSALVVVAFCFLVILFQPLCIFSLHCCTVCLDALGSWEEMLGKIFFIFCFAESKFHYISSAAYKGLKPGPISLFLSFLKLTSKFYYNFYAGLFIYLYLYIYRYINIMYTFPNCCATHHMRGTQGIDQ